MPLDWLSEVQDAPGTAEHYQRNDCANHEVRVRGARPSDQNTSDYHPRVCDHIIRRKNVACRHVGAPIPLLGDQHQAGDVGDQCDQPDTHHEHGRRLTSHNCPPNDLQKRAKRKHDLQPTSDVRCLHLQGGGPAHRIERQSVDRRIGEHVKRVRYETCGLGDQANDQLKDKHRTVDSEQQL